MRSSHSRFALLGALAACMALFAALPAFSGAATKVSTVNVKVSSTNDFNFVLSSKTVKAGTVTFKFTNSGQLPHDFKLCSSNKGGTGDACTGKVTPMISPGQHASLTVKLTKTGKYEYLCTVSGHAAAGMKGLLVVK
jgi:uncharacterized cupredoxin-like copper-binding protein